MMLGDFAKQVIKEISARLIAEPVETPRLLLRPFRDSDLADLYEYLAQKEQQRLAGNSPCDSVDEGCGWNISCVPSIPRRILPSF